MQKIPFRSKNAHLIKKMQENSINAEKFQKFRKIPLMQKNSINEEKFNKFKKNSIMSVS
jgi:hypothetical protein